MGQYKIVKPAIKDLFLKIILLGDAAVGKTSLRNRFLGTGFRENYVPTLGAQISIKKIVIDGKIVSFQIWDLAGQPRFNEVRKLYYRGSNVAILLYDITKPQSLSNLTEWIKSLHQHCFSGTKIPLIVVGNKIDLRLSQKDTLTTKTGQDFVNSLKQSYPSAISIYFIETSAKTGENITETFEMVANEFIRLYELKKDLR